MPVIARSVRWLPVRLPVGWPLGALVLAVALALTGCVDGDAESEEPAGSGGNGEGVTVEVTLGQPHEFAIQLSPDTVASGAVTFEVRNAGELPHQFVLTRHEGDPSSLPVVDVGVDTAAIEILGDSGALDPGASASVTAELEPGTYVVFSNLGGHYSAGMFTTLTVE